MKSKKIYIWIPLLLLAFPATYYTAGESFKYHIRSKAIIFPKTEWVLTRSVEGNLLNTLKDYQYNSISDFSVSEFQRGDYAGFELVPDVFNHQIVQAGDTVGRLLSQFETANLSNLKGELMVQQKLLEVYLSGEKPELLEIANEKRTLARQDYENQQRITDRNKVLFEKTFISEEEYEISVNELNIKRQNLLIAESEYTALSTGAKQQEIDYVKANIEAIENQIEQLSDLFSKYVITSPITGKIIRQQESSQMANETIIKVADTSIFILVIPIDTYNVRFIKIGQKVIFSGAWDDHQYTATIASFDNSAQRINGREKVFLTALTDSLPPDHSLFPNMLTDIEIPSEPLSVIGYISRLINEIYNN